MKIPQSRIQITLGSVILLEEKNFYLAVHDFFAEAARILLSPDTPCGCMVVLSAVNISEGETDIIRDLRRRRLETKNMFARKIRQAVDEGQLPADTDSESLACAFNTFLEGLSLQAQSGMGVKEMGAVASYAVRMLPKWRKHLKQFPGFSE